MKTIQIDRKDVRREEIVEFPLPQRLPLLDQIMELADKMKDTHSPKEIGEILSKGADLVKYYNCPIFIVKKRNERI